MSSDRSRPEDADALERLGRARDILVREIHKIIVGQDEVIEQILVAMFCRGHCLLVGVPGLAKTLLISTIARVLQLEFRRIQFTPDLMPSDITGTDVIEEDVASGKRTFRFIKGPIFGNIILADEINRTPPKTQAALLQAMQEYQVTAGGRSYDLDLPFFVLATQNPIEQEGTYPLPEAQLDRFMFNLFVDYPTKAEEHQIVKQTTREQDSDVKVVLRGKDILAVQKIVRRVPVSDHVIDYAIRLVRATRRNTEDAPPFVDEWLAWGAGPRAAQYLILGAKARAVLHGRYNVTCNDVRAMTIPVLRHRIFTNFNADAEGVDSVRVVKELLKVVTEPSEADYAAGG
jgi:MoxR-like ATPase